MFIIEKNLNVSVLKKTGPYIPESHSEAATAWQCGVGIGDLGDRAQPTVGRQLPWGLLVGLPSQSSASIWQPTNCDSGGGGEDNQQWDANFPWDHCAPIV